MIGLVLGHVLIGLMVGGTLLAPALTDTIMYGHSVLDPSAIVKGLADLASSGLRTDHDGPGRGIDDDNFMIEIIKLLG